MRYGIVASEEDEAYHYYHGNDSGDGLNLYAFCEHNPVRYVDPSGYAKKCSTGVEDSTGKRCTGDGNPTSGKCNRKTLLESTPDEIANMTRKELQDSIPEGWDF